MTFQQRARTAATVWKKTAPVLPEAARAAGCYGGRGSYDFCLPPAFASYNLLPHVRSRALELFVELGIPWHQGCAGGPSNHLLSSQVQCANALTPMVNDADLVCRAFCDVLPIWEVLEIEPHRYLTFEFIGEQNYFHEGTPAGIRIRGANCTSVDAAIRYRNRHGNIELALIEWKYTEDYVGHELSADRAGVREPRYREAWARLDGPLQTDLIPYEDMFVEPFYQLMRQQLLAAELERHHELGADTVRVLHIAPAGNDEYQASLNRDSHRRLGPSVYEVWRRLLRSYDVWVVLPAERFHDPAITSAEYVSRYAHT